MPYLQVELDAIKRAHAAAPIAGIPASQVLGGLVELWAWCWSEKQERVSALQLEGLFGGAGPRLVDALEAFGFLERVDGAIRVRGTERYLRLSEARARGAAATNAKRTSDARATHERRTSDARATHKHALTPSIDPSIIDHRKSTSLASEPMISISEGAEPGKAPGSTLPEKPLFEETPFTVFLRATWPDVRDPHAAEVRWSAAYPGVDLLAEALRARAWEEDNPKRRKINHARFLGSWFSTQQDKPRTSPVKPSPATSEPRAWEPQPLPPDALSRDESKARLAGLLSVSFGEGRYAAGNGPPAQKEAPDRPLGRSGA